MMHSSKFSDIWIKLSLLEHIHNISPTKANIIITVSLTRSPGRTLRNFFAWSWPQISRKCICDSRLLHRWLLECLVVLYIAINKEQMYYFSTRNVLKSFSNIWSVICLFAPSLPQRAAGRISRVVWIAFPPVAGWGKEKDDISDHPHSVISKNRFSLLREPQ